MFRNFLNDVSLQMTEYEISLITVKKIWQYKCQRKNNIYSKLSRAKKQ